jgi:hypothetical protein
MFDPTVSQAKQQAASYRALWQATADAARAARTDLERLEAILEEAEREGDWRLEAAVRIRRDSVGMMAESLELAESEIQSALEDATDELARISGRSRCKATVA